VTDSVEEKIVNLQERKKVGHIIILAYSALPALFNLLSETHQCFSSKTQGMANEILRGADDGDQLESAAKPSLEDFKLLLGR
jgi:hypothetical protein